MFINVGNKPLGNRLQKFDPALNKLAELCFPTFLLVDQVTAGHDLCRASTDGIRAPSGWDREDSQDMNQGTETEYSEVPSTCYFF